MNKTGILNSDLKLPDLNNTRTQGRFILISLLSALFIIYPNISIFSLERQYVGEQKHTAQLLFFGFRYLYFSGLIWFLIWFNLRKISEDALKSRLLQAFVITVVFGLAYIPVLCYVHFQCFTRACHPFVL
jgi:predicted membrane protein